MVDGPFKRLFHRHTFKDKGGYTIMVDEFFYESPMGFLGKIADLLFLKRYMRELILYRNQIIKHKAEYNPLQHDIK
jgi:ligand-binding SRPBCC domain-containing protein